MKSFLRHRYQQWLKAREYQLASRDLNRFVGPFDWGIEWVQQWPVAKHVGPNADSPREYLRALNRLALTDSDRFFAYETPGDFALQDGVLRFTSAVSSPHPENNIVYAQWFPAKNGNRAVVLVPHWNATWGQYGALCRAIQSLGISVLRISPPYHAPRTPSELVRADYAVSSNIARTIDATRQAVVDIRSCYDWLQQQGHGKLGLVGISLGSCYGFLASAHDSRIKINSFNHFGTYFADIVWTGVSTRHVREGLEKGVTLECLRDVWRVISPQTYIPKFSRQEKDSFFLYARYDTTVLPEYSEGLINAARQHNWRYRVVALPCAHYTSGETPFKFLVGYHICAYLRNSL